MLRGDPSGRTEATSSAWFSRGCTIRSSSLECSRSASGASWVCQAAMPRSRKHFEMVLSRTELGPTRKANRRRTRGADALPIGKALPKERDIQSCAGGIRMRGTRWATASGRSDHLGWRPLRPPGLVPALGRIRERRRLGADEPADARIGLGIGAHDRLLGVGSPGWAGLRR
jgi:hypothetical protein